MYLNVYIGDVVIQCEGDLVRSVLAADWLSVARLSVSHLPHKPLLSHIVAQLSHGQAHSMLVMKVTQ